MKTIYIAILAVVLALSTAIPCSAKPATNGPARDAKAAERLDIGKWPAYQGAEMVQQIVLSGKELKALVGRVLPGVQPLVRGLKHVAILSYRLPATAAMKDVIAFYEPRALDAGYKILSKDLSEPGEESVVYAGPKENILVLSVDSEGGEGRTLEIVSVEGPLSSLASMGEVMKKVGTRSGKPAQESTNNH